MRECVMKTRKVKTIIRVTLAMLCAVFVMGTAPMANAQDEGYGYTLAEANALKTPADYLYCRVTENNWDFKHPNIWTRVWLANLAGNSRGCLEHIDIAPELNSINLPMEIYLTETNRATEYFAFGPKELGDGQKRPTITVDGSFSYTDYLGMYPSVGADEMEANKNYPCVIRMETNQSAVQNVQIKGRGGERTIGENDALVNGLCLQNNDYIVKDVQLSGFSGSAIRLSSSVTKFKFEGDNNIISDAKIGIELLGGASPNRDIPDLSKVKIEKAAKYFIKAPAPAYIDHERLNLTLSTHAKGERQMSIFGEVTSCDTSKDDSDNPKDPECKIGQLDDANNCIIDESGVEVEKIILYFVANDPETDLEQPFEVGRYPVSGQSYNSKGQFSISFTDADLLAAANKHIESAEAKMTAADLEEYPGVILLAEAAQKGTGSSSSIIAMRNINNYNTDPCAKSGGGAYNSLLFMNISDCNKELSLVGQSVDFETDTDGDGIFDYIEMRLQKDGKWKTEGVCSCGDTLTCWKDADTDHDGIPDGVEAICEDGSRLINIQHEDEITTASDGYEMCGQGKKFKDFDEDGKADVRDPDSDEDNVVDGIEDRARLYEPSRKAFLYYIEEGSLKPLTLRLDNGEGGVVTNKVPCYDPNPESDTYTTDLTDFIDYDEDLGVAYSLVLIKTDENGIQEMEYIVPNTPEVQGRTLEEGHSIHAVTCRNAMLTSPSNFNGVVDGADRSNPADADSDDDGFCDGDIVVYPYGQVSSGADPICSGINDKCPLKKNTKEGGAPGPNDCTLDCVPGEMREIIADPEEIYIDANHQNFLDLDNNGEFDLFEIGFEDGKLRPDKLINICGDWDEDGIPNCIEALVANEGKYGSIGQCAPKQDPLLGGVVPLNPFTADSDLDGFGDGHKAKNSDICPMTHGATDGTVDDGLSCEPDDIYNDFPILAFYLDRDNDDLRDVQEFGSIDELISSNGVWSSSMGHSNPLDNDSDDDQLLDWYEKQYGTNPNDDDTDDDGLSDYREVNMDGDPKTNNGKDGKNIGHNYICGIFNTDTDPLEEDTDGDGLEDGTEVDVLNSNPNDIDSDNDGLCDGLTLTDAEGNVICEGEIRYIPQYQPDSDWEPDYYESDPCNDNTDNPLDDPEGDQAKDGEEPYGCRNNTDPICWESEKGNEGTAAGGDDTDLDGIPDKHEAKFGAEVGKQDTDGDGLIDGCEDGVGELCNAQRDNYKFDPSFYYDGCEPDDFKNCDTDPNNPDSDDDGLNDKQERNYPSNPWESDTDGDCIPDGVEDADQDGKWDTDETKAASGLTTIDGVTDMFEAIDTDGDGLTDGQHARYRNSGWEDDNCNGIVDVNADGELMETDPRNWDTDGDNISDYDEMTAHDGYFNIDRVGEAVTGRGRGCSMIAGGSVDSGMMMIFAGLLFMVAVMRKRAKAKAIKK